MAKHKSMTKYNGDLDSWLENVMRRKDTKSSGKTIDMLRDRISRKVDRINAEQRQQVDDMIQKLEKLQHSFEEGSSEYVNMQMAIDNFRTSHMETIELKDLSGKVRTTREAKEILRRLDSHTASARNARFKENYLSALRKNGHAWLADKLGDVTDEEFMLMYYSNSSASIGFEYNETYFDMTYTDDVPVFEARWLDAMDNLMVAYEIGILE